MQYNSDKSEDSFRKLGEMYSKKRDLAEKNNKQMSAKDADIIVENILINHGSKLGLSKFD